MESGDQSDPRDGEVPHHGDIPIPADLEEQPSEPQLPRQGQLVWAGFVARDGSNLAELPILIPKARGLWRSVNYTSREHFISDDEQP